MNLGRLKTRNFLSQVWSACTAADTGIVRAFMTGLVFYYCGVG